MADDLMALVKKYQSATNPSAKGTYRRQVETAVQKTAESFAKSAGLKDLSFDDRSVATLLGNRLMKSGSLDIQEQTLKNLGSYLQGVAKQNPHVVKAIRKDVTSENAREWLKSPNFARTHSPAQQQKIREEASRGSSPLYPRSWEDHSGSVGWDESKHPRDDQGRFI